MADTQLQIINKVQRRLRETETASVSTSEYSQLLGDFLNDIIGEMNEYDWLQFYANESVDMIIGTHTYTLTAPANAVLSYVENTPLVTLTESDSDTTGKQLIQLHPEAMALCLMDQSAPDDDEPVYFSLSPSPTADSQILTVYPAPASADNNVTLRFWTPQAELAVDGTADNTTIYLSERALYLGTLWLALNERGEELGEPGGVASLRYDNAKRDAMGYDIAMRGRTNQYEMYRD
jgi:hypothetical protein